MPGIVIQISQFLLALSLLIVLHEGGHFFFARLFKTRVEKFYLFFDFLFPFSNVLPFSLWKKKVGETEWGIGWFPLGGYVKIAGMVDESMDKEQLARSPEPWEFRSKKPYQRLLIMLGGVLVNVLLAFLIYAMILFVWGKERIPLSDLKGGITVTDSLGTVMGFKNGDQIVALNGKNLQYMDEVLPQMPFAKTVTVVRNGNKVTLSIPENWLGELKKKGIFAFNIPVVIDSLVPGAGAAKAGLLANDQIVGLNGVALPFQLFRDSLDKYKNQTVSVMYNRNGVANSVAITVSDSGTIGFRPTADAEKLQRLGLLHPQITKYGFFESFPAGAAMGVEKIKSYWKQLGLFLKPKTGAFKQAGGFGSMASIFPRYWDWEIFWNITAFISIALAIMNLLPIPGLDGGHVVFTLIEMIIGRKVNDRVVEIATTVGLVLLLTLMVLVNANDIIRWWNGHF
ncbi:MAG: RIP metalloprotease RseP [Edaphocola sp.]